MTKRGYLGLGSVHVQMDDMVVVLGGGDVLRVLWLVESVEGERQYRLVGEAYVHEILDGEAVMAKHEVHDFEIV